MPVERLRLVETLTSDHSLRHCRLVVSDVVPPTGSVGTYPRNRRLARNQEKLA
jgi:hypothetical protein